MKKLLVLLALYVALGAEASAFDGLVPGMMQPVQRVYGYGRLWAYFPPTVAAQQIPPQFIIHRTYYTPYRYAGSQYLSEQSSSLPLGWNRYYLAARMQAPYSLIIRNSPAYSSYQRPQSSAPRTTRPAVTLYRNPTRELPSAARPTAQVSSGMTEDQVKTQLGPPLVQVAVGEQRSWVYDLLLVEFEQGLVKNVVVR